EGAARGSRGPVSGGAAARERCAAARRGRCGAAGGGRERTRVRAARTGLRALAPLALMGLIFYLSDQPSVGRDLPAWTRVVAHFGEYFLLASLWIWALVPALGRRGLVLAATISLLYAISDEYHQSFVPE